MANYKVTDAELVSVANAIRAKGGTESQLEFPTGFISAIGDISTGVEITSADNGKVVVNAALQAQTARESDITQNGTYDTTTNNQVVVNVMGGGCDDFVCTAEDSTSTMLIVAISEFQTILSNYTTSAQEGE